MVNLSKIVVAAASTLMLVVTVGCGGGSSGSAAPSGTYESKFGPPGNGIKLNFVGNSVEITVSEGGRDQMQKTSFVTSGDSIIIDVPESEGPDLTLKRNGAALETTMQGMTMRFEKL